MKIMVTNILFSVLIVNVCAISTSKHEAMVAPRSDASPSGEKKRNLLLQGRVRASGSVNDKVDVLATDPDSSSDNNNEPDDMSDMTDNNNYEPDEQSEQEADDWLRVSFVHGGGKIPSSLLTTGQYKNMGQCPMKIIDEMELECKSNASKGSSCKRTQFIQSHSEHWLHDQMSKQKSESGVLWKINESYSLDGAKVKMLSPRGVYLIEGFLTAREADALVETYNKTSDHDKKPGIGCPVLRHDCWNPQFLTYPGEHCELRHATSKWFPDEEQGVPPVKQKLELLTRVPRKFQEHLQMSKYEPGDFFSAHFDDDACHDQLPGVSEKCKMEDRRMLTVLTYLTDHTEGSGGATYFPDLDIRIKGKKGDAVLFMPVYLDGTLNPHMMHVGEDAFATKMIAQNWFGVGAAWQQAAKM